MRTPINPVVFILFVALVILLLTLIQIGLFTIAAEKLGISPHVALLWLFISLLGSSVNLPIARIQTDSNTIPPANFPHGWILGPKDLRRGQTLIAINMGGALMPLTFSLFLFSQHTIPLLNLILVITSVTGMSYLFSRPIAGLGVAMPIFIAPVTAAIAAILLAPEYSAPVAYIGGTLGVLLGADLLRLKDIRHMGTPVASIGGAGTFDGIFITGIVAVLLA